MMENWTLEEVYRYANLIMGTAAGQGKTYDALLWALEQLDKANTQLADNEQRIRQLSDEKYVYLVRAKQAESALQWEQIQHAETLSRLSIQVDATVTQIMPVRGNWSGKTHTRPDFPVDPSDYE